MQRHSAPSKHKPRSPSVGASAARRGNGSVRGSSRDSFSAAASLVIKPSTPPKMPKPGTPPRMPSAQHFNNTCSQGPAEQPGFSTPADLSKEEAVPVPVVPVPVEVVSLSGNTIVRDNFLLGDKVVAIKKKIAAAAGHPIFQQQLTWQGSLLDEKSTLQAHGLSPEGAIVQLMLRSLPDASELEDAKAIMHAGLGAIEVLANARGRRPKAEISELAAFARPPPVCETVCQAVLYLLAGIEPSIQVKSNGSPKDATWKSCAAMMRSGSFVNSMQEVPAQIDCSRCLRQNVRAAKELLQAVPGASHDEKVAAVGRCSLGASRFCGWALCMVDYFEAAAEISERFGANLFILQNPNATKR
mmetsp:Transcript_159371/g.293736  ORF Transcript_159371/g.293736 Transcript_159371/m.293736 type:complete len:357 (-) Transcript_159371:239-1309(-)